MKSKEEIAKDYFNEIESLGLPADRNMIAIFIDGMTEQEIISKQQTAELQQEVERLREALEQCKGLTTWGTKDATHVFNQIDKIASKALNPPTR